MQFVPHEAKQRTHLRNKIRGAVIGAIVGFLVGAIGALYFGWGVLLTSILVSALLGFKLVGGLLRDPPVCWWKHDQ